MAKNTFGKVLDVAQAIPGIGGAIAGGINAVKSLFSNPEKEAQKADARQLRQQQGLTDIQSKANKDLADYEQNLKMQMWKDTNYGAQMKQAEMAGLSKAAVLGAGGTGVGQGASVGSASGGSADGGVASQMAQAQIENMKANTMKTKAEAEKIAGVDTKKVSTEIEDLSADIKNKAIQNRIMVVQEETQELELAMKEQSYDDVLDNIHHIAVQNQTIAKKLLLEQDIAEHTKYEIISQARAQTAIMWAQKVAIDQGVQLSKAQIKNMQEQIATQLKGQELDLKIAEGYMTTMLQTAGISAAGGILRDGAEILMKGGRIPIKGFTSHKKAY